MEMRNLNSPRSGNPVKNQFVLATKDGEIFKSYKSNIALRTWDGDVLLDPNYWDYSVTTLKYLKVFLGINASKSDIQKMIDDGTYKTSNLN